MLPTRQVLMDANTSQKVIDMLLNEVDALKLKVKELEKPKGPKPSPTPPGPVGLEEWIALQDETPIEPIQDLPICDCHHHLFDFEKHHGEAGKMWVSKLLPEVR